MSDQPDTSVTPSAAYTFVKPPRFVPKGPAPGSEDHISFNMTSTRGLNAIDTDADEIVRKLAEAGIEGATTRTKHGYMEVRVPGPDDEERKERLQHIATEVTGAQQVKPFGAHITKV